MRLPEEENIPDGIQAIPTHENGETSPIRLTCEPEGILRIDRLSSAPCLISIYAPSGLRIYRTRLGTETLRVPLPQGAYIISVQTPQARSCRTVFLK